jgi:hypothetical protein
MNSLLTKIRKLLALADTSANDNETERATALRQAESLMVKHSITMADLGEQEQLDQIGELGLTKVRAQHHGIMAIACYARLVSAVPLQADPAFAVIA